MGMPAARCGDPGSGSHAPSLLAPGPGSPSVQFNGQPAWRAFVDQSACSWPTPSVHGPEICYLGSLTVTINGQMAVREGDVVIAMGPPNRISKGSPDIVIGDPGIGLAAQAAMNEYCKKVKELANDWPSLTEDQRRQRLEQLVNERLGVSGVPHQNVATNPSLASHNAQWDFASDTVEISPTDLSAPNFEIADTVYHEARHAEQWHLMGRYAAQHNLPMPGITPNASAAARSAPPLTGPEENLARTCYESVYGSRAGYRNGVLGDVQNRYDEYRALPEERDAWRTGDGLPCK